MTWDTDVAALSPTHWWKCTEAAGALSAANSGSGGTALTPTNAVFGVPGLEGTACYLDGLTAFLRTASAIDLSAFSKVTVGCILYTPSFSSTDRIGWEFGTGTGLGTGRFGFFPSSANTPNTKPWAYTLGGVGYNSGEIVRWDAMLRHLVLIDYDLAQTTETVINLDGVAVTNTHQLTSNNLNAGFATDFLNIGARFSGSASKFSEQTFNHFLIFGGGISDVQKAALATSLNIAQQGVPTWRSETLSVRASLPAYNSGTTPPVSALSYHEIDYDGEMVEATGNTTLFALQPGSAVIKSSLNNVAHAANVTFTANGSKTQILNFGSAGTTKRIRIYNGIQLSSSGIKGSFVDTIRTDARYTCTVIPDPAFVPNRIIIWGDSIPEGTAAESGMLGSYSQLLRFANFNVLCETSGNRRFFDDCATHGAVLTHSAKLLAGNPRMIIVNNLINDWGGNVWATPAAMGVRYADFFDTAHASAPNTILVSITPFLWSNEAAVNGFGHTVPQYRAEVTTIASTRPWMTVLSGLSFSLIFPTDYAADNVHLNDAGHVKIFNGVLPTARRMNVGRKGLSSLSSR